MAAGTTVRTEELAAELRLVLARWTRRLRALESGELTPTQMSVLATVESRGPVSAGMLAELERMRPPSLTPVLRHLESHGLVRRVSEEGDARVAVLTPTADGRAALRRVRTQRAAFLVRLLRRRSSDELAALAAAVAVLTDMLEED